MRVIQFVISSVGFAGVCGMTLQSPLRHRAPPRVSTDVPVPLVPVPLREESFPEEEVAMEVPKLIPRLRQSFEGRDLRVDIAMGLTEGLVFELSKLVVDMVSVLCLVLVFSRELGVLCSSVSWKLTPTPHTLTGDFSNHRHSHLPRAQLCPRRSLIFGTRHHTGNLSQPGVSACQNSSQARFACGVAGASRAQSQAGSPVAQACLSFNRHGAAADYDGVERRAVSSIPVTHTGTCFTRSPAFDTFVWSAQHGNALHQRSLYAVSRW